METPIAQTQTIRAAHRLDYRPPTAAEVRKHKASVARIRADYGDWLADIWEERWAENPGYAQPD